MVPLLFLVLLSGVSAAPLTILSTFNFSDYNDGMACLSTSSDLTLGLAASDGGDIFVWPLNPPPTTVWPAFIAGLGSEGALFVACQSNPAGDRLYVLDTRQLGLYVYSTNSGSLTQISFFPDEVVGSLTCLAIDWVRGIAYVGTRHTGNLYSLEDIVTPGQTTDAYYSYQVAGDVSAMVLTGDGQTLYYVSPPQFEGQSAEILALSVQSMFGDTQLVFASPLLTWPDTLVLWKNTLYLKDGGVLHGEDDVPWCCQSVFSVDLSNASTLTTLYTSSQTNLPSGMFLAADNSTLVITSKQTLDALQLYQPPVVPAHISSSGQSSSPFSSSVPAVTSSAQSSPPFSTSLPTVTSISPSSSVSTGVSADTGEPFVSSSRVLLSSSSQPAQLLEGAGETSTLALPVFAIILITLLGFAFCVAVECVILRGYVWHQEKAQPVHVQLPPVPYEEEVLEMAEITTS